MNRRFLLHDSAGHAAHGIGFRMPLYYVYVLDHDAVVGVDAQHRTALTFVFADQHDDVVALSNLTHDARSPLQHLRRQRNDLHELLTAQLTSHGPEDTSSNRLQLVVQQHCGVAVETYEGSIRAPDPFLGAYHEGVVHLALLDFPARNRFLYAHFD